MPDLLEKTKKGRFGAYISPKSVLSIFLDSYTKKSVPILPSDRMGTDKNYNRNKLFPVLFHSLFDGNCTSNSHTNHGVVAGADQAHHLNVSRNG